MNDILAKLAEPFPPDRVSWRIGSVAKDKPRGMALAYIDARDAQDRLDSVMGTDWENEFVAMPNGTLCCRIGLYIDGRMRWRSDGAGATDVEAEKGTYSDAFKRAAVKWGIARYLYEMSSPWVELDGTGKFAKIAEHEMPKLRALLERGGVPPSRMASNSERALTTADVAAPLSKAEARPEYQRLSMAMKHATSVSDLLDLLKAESAAINALPQSWRDDLRAEAADIKQALQSRAA